MKRLIRRFLRIHSPSEHYLGACWCQPKEFRRRSTEIWRRGEHGGYR
jgi:hypothetical protein